MIVKNKSIPLHGCAPIPLAHYLKALGIFRLVAEQLDTSATAHWQNDTFYLQGDFTAEDLVTFFRDQYRPSPIIAPWNGGSGFYEKDNKKAISGILSSDSDRLRSYKNGIQIAQNALIACSLTEKPSSDEKAKLLLACRNCFNDDQLQWLDAALVLSHGGPKFPPLLGTGGNDGRLEFTNNFMQRIGEVMKPETGKASSSSQHWLEAALFGEAASGITGKAPIGQYFPGAAGGANSTSGFDAPSAVNPWDYILLMEGTLQFAAASVKRLESVHNGELVYPFCVRQSGVGYASASTSDENDARCEMWMPLWDNAVSLTELQSIVNEGRAQVHGRTARTGIDFAQAAVSLGVDRGIKSFQRFGFQVRNGLAYFATPLDRITVKRNASADLLADFEDWHDRLRSKAGPKLEAPARVRCALNQLERQMLAVCQDGSIYKLTQLLATLGNTERALAGSYRWSKDKAFLRPLANLRTQWLRKANDGSTEFRLAASVAGLRSITGKNTLHLREHLEPVNVGSNKERYTWIKWSDTPSNNVVWREGNLIGSFNAILERRAIHFQQHGVEGWNEWTPLPRQCLPNLGDIRAFIENRIDESKLADLIWGLSLINWESPEIANITFPKANQENIQEPPSALYALLRLCFQRKDRETNTAIPVVPEILRRAAAGDGRAASNRAARRLRASGLSPMVHELPVTGEEVRRTAAALIFPFFNTKQLEKFIIQTNETK